MKILHIVRQFYPLIGGLENFVLSLALEQIKNGIEVSILTLNRSFIDNKKLPKSEYYEKIKINRIPFIGSKRYPIALSSINYLKDIDLVHIHGVDFFVDYLSWTKCFHRKKIILHTHGGFFHTQKGYWFKKIYFKTITKSTLKRCDKIIAISNNDIKLFSKVSNNIVLIENGVNVEKYQISKRVEKGVLLYVGRIDVHKRVDTLIKTAIQLNKTGIDVVLKIIGPDWKGLKQSLINLVPDNLIDKIIFKGSIDDKTLKEEFSKAHLFVSASDYEGFGISAIESMASGTPTVLNNIDSFKSFLRNKSFGAIVDFEDIENSANTIKKFLSLPDEKYETLSKEARDFASKYSWTNVETQIRQEYIKIINNTV